MAEEASGQHSVWFDCPSLPCVAVTVYVERAEVKRLVKCSLKSGINEVLIKKLPKYLDKDSVRVDGRGKATICEVRYQETAVSQPQPVYERLEPIRELLEKLKADKFRVKAELDRLKCQRDVFNGIAKQIATGSSTAEEKRNGAFLEAEEQLDVLEKFLAVYSKRVAELDEKIYSETKSLEKIGEEIDAAKYNLDSQGADADRNRMSGEFSIILETSEACEAELVVSYLVLNATWSSSYDVRVSSDKRSMKVHYYGLIEQNSGEDWEKTSVWLSTATPSVGGEVPTLTTKRVSIRSPIIEKCGLSKERGKQLQGIQREQEDNDDDAVTYDFQTIAAVEISVDETRVEKSAFSTNFQIAHKSSIPSDNTTHKVTVAILELEGKFEHETVPIKMPYAFLKANVVNKSSYPFLPGPMMVFLDNSFIAKSSLKAVSPMEEFSCSLGIDPEIRVDYKPVRKFKQESGLISKHTTTTYEQKIEIKNTKTDQEPAKIKLLEQIPLSTDDKVKVNLLEPLIPKNEKEASKLAYKLNKEHNLEWNFKVDPGKTELLVVKYTVEHPRSDTIKFDEDDKD